MYKLSGYSKSNKWIEMNVSSVAQVAYYIKKFEMVEFDVDKILLNKSLMSLISTNGIEATVNACVKVPFALLKLI